MSDLHARSLVLDAHMDTPSRMLVEGVDIAERTDGQADLVRWREGGIDVQVLAIWVDTIYVPHHAARRALQQIDGIHRVVESNRDRVELARSIGDIHRITDSGKLALLIAIEGGAAIQDDLALLRNFHRLGATSMTLTHSASTGWADSSTDSPRWGGLNEFGRSVIREMNRLGMAVDVSHVSDDTLDDVLETSRAPIIASHSSCRALCDHPRNLRDDQMRRVAAGGGVIGINFFAGFVDQGYQDALLASRGDLLRGLNAPTECAPERLDALSAERYRSFYSIDLPRPPFERIVEHIDHAVSVVGPAHVGIGSDLDSGPIPTPVGMDGAQDFPRITDALAARGYADDDIVAILGGNFLRVYGEIQRAAGPLAPAVAR